MATTTSNWSLLAPRAANSSAVSVSTFSAGIAATTVRAAKSTGPTTAMRRRRGALTAIEARLSAGSESARTSDTVITPARGCTIGGKVTRS